MQAYLLTYLACWLLCMQAVTCLRFTDCGSILVTGGEDTLVNAWLLADVVDAIAGQHLQVGAAAVLWRAVLSTCSIL